MFHSCPLRGTWYLGGPVVWLLPFFLRGSVFHFSYRIRTIEETRVPTRSMPEDACLAIQVQWPVAGSAHMQQAPSEWHLILPSNRHRIVFSWSLRRAGSRRVQHSISPVARATVRPSLPRQQRNWLRRGPPVFHCNTSSFYPEWSELRHRCLVAQWYPFPFFWALASL